jgi:hypothetical protein
MRKTDKNPKTHFRSERIFSMNGNWYFATREGEQGPFASRTRAEAGLARFLTEQECLETLNLSRIKGPIRVTTDDLVDAEGGFARQSTKRLVY